MMGGIAISSMLKCILLCADKHKNGWGKILIHYAILLYMKLGLSRLTFVSRIG
jgi:hypothetical protein